MRFISAAIAALLSCAALAYPDKPVQYIIPFAPDVIDVTLEKMPAFLAEKSRACIDDAKAAGLLK